MYDKTLAQAQETGSVEVSAIAGYGSQLVPVGYRPTISEQLGMRRAQLLAELADLDKAIEMARIQKDAMFLIDAISKTNVGNNRNY